MVALALIQAWRARHLSTEFAESKSIANALLISLLLALFAVPVLSLTQDDPNVDTFINTIFVSIITGNILCSLFVPKILFLRKEKLGKEGVPKIAGTVFARASIRAIKTSFSTNRTSTSSNRTSGGNFNSTSKSISSKTSMRRDVSGGSDPSPEEVGEKILTTKTQEELVAEISKLLLSLETVEGENADLKKRLLKFESTGEDKKDVGCADGKNVSP